MHVYVYCLCCVTGAPAEESEIIQSHDISPGDYVIVKLDPEVFRAMHEGSEQAGWDDHMMEVGWLQCTLYILNHLC